MDEFFHITDANFEQEVLKSSGPVLMEFGATWCVPCKQLEPELIKLGGEWGGKVRLAKADVDESPDLAMKFGVMGVPTIILFVGGQAKQRLTGYQPRQRILEKMGPYLG
jgi:thioredoxin 1